ncbi:DUF952 domain-containing protein [Ilumatobacter sp.]|uniref:DUF952 domain-containing protein n=1 Tax=Ilumatobacter sp. TaxID=1967498 RepID=UPI003B5255BB
MSDAALPDDGVAPCGDRSAHDAVESGDADLPVFHAALPDDWVAAFETGEYAMSTRGRTLAEEGFVHASTRSQVEGVANRFYADVDQLVLLMIDPVKVPSEIRWEPPAPGVDELFPHVYGPIPVAAVVDARFWMRSPGSRWTLPGP